MSEFGNETPVDTDEEPATEISIRRLDKIETTGDLKCGNSNS
ncbi:hypothetical protein [Microtetraspora niveoalba]|nr:hypothetical protein [Microtetraspora niveoalba]